MDGLMDGWINRQMGILYNEQTDRQMIKVNKLMDRNKGQKEMNC